MNQNVRLRTYERHADKTSAISVMESLHKASNPHLIKSKASKLSFKAMIFGQNVWGKIENSKRRQISTSSAPGQSIFIL